MLNDPEVLMVLESPAALEDPFQLDLFSPEPQGLLLEDAPSAAAAVSHALERGQTVKLRKRENGFELHLILSEVKPAPLREGRLGETCGFSRRAVELLVRSVDGEGRALWARPAGAGWSGWAEWGTLASNG